MSLARLVISTRDAHTIVELTGQIVGSNLDMMYIRLPYGPMSDSAQTNGFPSRKRRPRRASLGIHCLASRLKCIELRPSSSAGWKFTTRKFASRSWEERISSKHLMTHCVSAFQIIRTAAKSIVSSCVDAIVRRRERSQKSDSRRPAMRVSVKGAASNIVAPWSLRVRRQVLLCRST